jgi:protein-tyrosine phosphatase
MRERHVHRTQVTLADGAPITGVTFLGPDPYARDKDPVFGLYLDERWSPPWSHAHVDWPDFGLPADPEAFRAALLDLLARARSGDAVELGCLGGHGRTGTALACLAILAGAPSDAAVAWVRSEYCERAVETPEQEAFVRAFET